MSHEEHSTDIFEGPAFALVIGISTYQHGLEAGLVPEPKQFPHLKYAAKDAEDFATFLNGYGFIKYNVRLLIDEKATLTEIKDGFEQLRNDCEMAGANKPLVIVYFAGHGKRDSRDRHYLLPWEAEGHRLHATALSNRELNSYLNELNTNRLVVFLDACHSGGMGDTGARGDVEYDAGSNLGEGTGRWIIASCDKGQRSWEVGGNGIFTRQLLELLSGETDDFDENEKITTNMLYEPLQKRVIRVAREEYQERQEPIIVSVKESKGIVLAINQRARRNRIERERKKNEKLQTLLDAVCDKLRQRKHVLSPIVVTKLSSHFRNYKPQRPGFEEFYRVFDAFANVENALQRLPEICDDLIDAHEEATASPRPATKSLNSEPVSQVVDARDNKVLGSEKPVIRRAAPSVPERERKVFSDDDRDYILGEILRQRNYYQQASMLRRCLTGPVSESDFVGVVHRVTPADDTDPLCGILPNIVTRFGEKWPEGKILESGPPQNPLQAKLADRLRDKNKDG